MDHVVTRQEILNNAHSHSHANQNGDSFDVLQEVDVSTLDFSKLGMDMGTNDFSHITTGCDPTITPEIMIKLIVDAVEMYCKGPNVHQLTDTDPHMRRLVAEVMHRREADGRR